MPDSREQLKAMVQSLINGDETSAAEIHHQYIVSKTAEIAGFANGQQEPDDDQEDLNAE